MLIEEILAESAEQGGASNDNEGEERQGTAGPQRRVVVLGGGTHTRQRCPQVEEARTNYFQAGNGVQLSPGTSSWPCSAASISTQPFSTLITAKASASLGAHVAPPETDSFPKSLARKAGS